MLKVNWGIDKVVIEALSEGDPAELRPELRWSWLCKEH